VKKIVWLALLLIAPTAIADPLHVYKSETCGCCVHWIDHLEDSGFEVTAENKEDMNAIKALMGIGPRYQSCHTGVTKEGFFIEGHVPAVAINKFLSNPPEDAAGLTVPGMPVGSPGMEVGDRFQPYHVYLIDKDGGYRSFMKFDKPEDQEG